MKWRLATTIVSMLVLLATATLNAACPRFALNGYSMTLLLVFVAVPWLPEIVQRLQHFEATPKGLKLILARYEQTTNRSRPELRGLTPEDIWALATFAGKYGKRYRVADLNLTQRVAARVLVDFGLVYVDGKGDAGLLCLTPDGDALLSAAESIRV